MKNRIKFLLLSVVFIAGLLGCAEEQNFDQIDDLEIIPTAEASLFFLETPEALINLVSGFNFYSQTFEFTAFEEQFFADNVIEGVITYELENTTSKPLEISLEFLDATGATQDIENFMLPSAPTAVLTREVTYGPSGRSLDILRNTVEVQISATNLGDNTSVSSLPSPKVVLRSSGRFMIQLVE